jgi:hypothetical protein
MTNTQIYVLGMMAGCTPILLHWGWLLWRDVLRHPIEHTVFPTRTSAAHATSLLAGREISRFPYRERPHMPSSSTTPGRTGTRAGGQ